MSGSGSGADTSLSNSRSLSPQALSRCHASRVHVHVSVHLINKLSARMVSRHKLSHREGQSVCVCEIYKNTQ